LPARNRANQWERKGDFGKAMQDHGEAILSPDPRTQTSPS
jgi:hypothetical protein